MISKQKARRIAYDMVHHILETASTAALTPPVGWSEAETLSIEREIEKIIAELKKKSQ